MITCYKLYMDGKYAIIAKGYEEVDYLEDPGYERIPQVLPKDVAQDRQPDR
jgi:hypothetical protein